LLFAVVHLVKVKVQIKMASSSRLTRGIPGIMSDVIKVANTLRCVPSSKPGQRKDIEIARAVHVSGINLPCCRIQKIVIDKHLIPSRDEVGVNVIGDHAKESSKGTIDGVMESNAVEGI